MKNTIEEITKNGIPILETWKEGSTQESLDLALEKIMDKELVIFDVMLVLDQSYFAPSLDLGE